MLRYATFKSNCCRRRCGWEDVSADFLHPEWISWRIRTHSVGRCFSCWSNYRTRSNVRMLLGLIIMLAQSTWTTKSIRWHYGEKKREIVAIRPWTWMNSLILFAGTRRDKKTTSVCDHCPIPMWVINVRFCLLIASNWITRPFSSRPTASCYATRSRRERPSRMFRPNGIPKSDTFRLAFRSS